MQEQGASFAIDRSAYPNQREWLLPGDRDGIAVPVEQICAFIAATGVVAGCEAEIELALQEAVSNAVVHGCKGDASKMVWCWVGCDAALGVVIVVRDPGAGFDTSNFPDPLKPAAVGLDHGRGLYLIRNLMDEMTFSRGGRELCIRKRPQ